MLAAIERDRGPARRADRHGRARRRRQPAPAADHAPGDDAAREAAQAAFEEILDAAIALGGTVTGEHGVGLLKRDGMRRELDPGSLAMQAAVRRALDPHEIFNPGKG